MKRATPGQPRGFSLIEVLIAMAISVLVMASVFVLLSRSRETFRREPEVSDMNANARSGLDQISQELTVAGFATPPNMAVAWTDGGGPTPDEITIIYADPEIPVARPALCGAGAGGGAPCATIGTSSKLHLDPHSFSPQPLNYEDSYLEGMVLFALQGPGGDPACDSVPPAMIPIELTARPECTGAAPSSGPGACASLALSHRPRPIDWSPPAGFQNDVSTDCTVVGLFHVVQYRVSPPPPAANPALERRDVALREPWTAVASNIENLQFQYVQGIGGEFEDAPSPHPAGDDPASWVTRVRVTVAGRSASSDLQGGGASVFAAGDTHLRRSFTTTVSLRNQLSQAQDKAAALGLAGWN
jgi:prepilin-type N-terminal cleavage/methylation domain-containing protein